MLYAATRGHLQRVIDVALLVINMSRMATLIIRRDEYGEYQVLLLEIALALSFITQIIAGICFFVTQERENSGSENPGLILHYIAYICVGFILILNIFIAAFDASWAHQPRDPIIIT